METATKKALWVLSVAALLAGCSPSRLSGATGGDSGQDPIVIAHRGASGERPEHTLEAYRLAIEQGADLIEPDLVLTGDGVLVARHENRLSSTTDVASRPEFAARRTTKSIEGVVLTDWFTEDFTLAELRTLRTRERLPELRPSSAAFDGREQIPTFDEILDLALEAERRQNRTIGVGAETKLPTYFEELGLPHGPPLVAALRRAGLDRADAAVFVQSFEVSNLVELDAVIDTPLVQLIGLRGGPPDRPGETYAEMTTPKRLESIAEYADAIAPEKSLVIARGDGGASSESTGLVDRAHVAGLDVYVWTFRRENMYLPAEFWVGTDPTAPGDLVGEVELFAAEGVDGVFTDSPGPIVSSRPG